MNLRLKISIEKIWIFTVVRYMGEWKWSSLIILQNEWSVLGTTGFSIHDDWVHKQIIITLTLGMSRSFWNHSQIFRKWHLKKALVMILFQGNVLWWFPVTVCMKVYLLEDFYMEFECYLTLTVWSMGKCKFAIFLRIVNRRVKGTKMWVSCVPSTQLYGHFDYWCSNVILR